jgi:hypothetical protein
VKQRELTPEALCRFAGSGRISDGNESQRQLSKCQQLSSSGLALASLPHHADRCRAAYAERRSGSLDVEGRRGSRTREPGGRRECRCAAPDLFSTIKRAIVCDVSCGGGGVAYLCPPRRYLHVHRIPGLGIWHVDGPAQATLPLNGGTVEGSNSQKSFI